MSFESAVGYVLENEGLFVNDPLDRGKATNFGITMQMLAFHRASGVTVEDVERLTVEEAKDIYKKFYWDHMNLDRITPSIATAIMDMAVNMGEGMAIRLAQRTLGSVKGDGVLGSQTANALNNSEPFEFMFGFVSEIQDHYCDVVKVVPSEIRFLKGWLRRALRLLNLVKGDTL